MSARKARRGSTGIRRVLVWAAVLIAAAALVAGGFVEAKDPRFALSGVAVTGERKTPQEQIVLAAAFPRGANVWLLDTAGARRRIEALPWVQTAAVRRSWPNRVRIDVVERSPVARILLPPRGDAEEPVEQAGLIDASLRVLAVEPADASSEAGSLPVLRIDPVPVLEPGAVPAGNDVQTSYDVLLELRALGLRISEVDVAPATGVTVVCDDGLRVILGSQEELANKVALLRAIAAKIVQPRDVVYVDLRSVRAPTVLYR